MPREEVVLFMELLDGLEQYTDYHIRPVFVMAVELSFSCLDTIVTRLTVLRKDMPNIVGLC